MSSSIPIPSRPTSNRTSASASYDEDDMITLGTSLPIRGHRTFHGAAALQRASAAYTSQDDLATSWPPRPSVELVSRSAKRWVSGNKRASESASRRRESYSDDTRIMRFEPWDFSEVALATDEMRSAFQRGNARAERPPREGVCGTYFIRGGSDGGVMCVFKPIDEEAADIEMSPTFLATSSQPGLPFGDGTGTEFSLGPAHGASSPSSHSPHSFGYGFHRTRSLSSESDLGIESHSTKTPGFHAGEGAYKEVAAYLLDHDRFARVPQTALATCQFSSDVPEKNQSGKHIRAHSIIASVGGDSTIKEGDGLHQGIEESTVEPTRGSAMRTKMGALQVFVPNVGDADDFGPGVFDKDQVHRIAILDIRVLNHDRHGGNILVTKSASPNRRYNLVPIDHGYILPEAVQAIPWPVWMDWPMIREPISDRVRTYIEHLDAEAEANILDEELERKLRSGSLNILKIATMFLQAGVAAGLSLYEVGLLMYTRRETPLESSELVKIITEAEDAVNARDRNFAEGNTGRRGPTSCEDHLHRRHQSMSTLHVPDTFNDDYFIRYARKRVQDVISVAVAKKSEKEKTVRVAGRPPRLARSRSIPNFGIGGKPLHTLTKRANEPLAPTPASSPVSSGSIRSSATTALETQILDRASPAVRQAPIQIPINDRTIRRIAIPEPRVAPATDVGYFRERSISMPISRVCTEGNGKPGKPPSESSGSLPPLFKSARKSSPVAPQDLAVWGGSSS